MGERVIVFFDPKQARGGGQVVLEQLLAQLSPRASVGLVMPAVGRECLTIPSDVVQSAFVSEIIARVPDDEPLLLVANANASFPSVVHTAHRLRSRARTVSTTGIVHNYPAVSWKRQVTRHSLSRLDDAIVVEPGLLSLRRDAHVPSWMSVPSGHAVPQAGAIAATGDIKCFGRPDRTKGLHLVPEIFSRVEKAGYRCRIALGDALDGDRRYEATLRRSLEPWLEDGTRSHTWIAPGDVFLLPSVSGETASLASQEAMARGAWVVASRVGLLPYLAPAGEAVTTFSPGDTSAAAAEIVRVQHLPTETFARRCLRSQESILARRGRWFAETTELLLERHNRLVPTG